MDSGVDHLVPKSRVAASWAMGATASEALLIRRIIDDLANVSRREGQGVHHVDCQVEQCHASGPDQDRLRQPSLRIFHLARQVRRGVPSGVSIVNVDHRGHHGDCQRAGQRRSVGEIGHVWPTDGHTRHGENAPSATNFNMVIQPWTLAVRRLPEM